MAYLVRLNVGNYLFIIYSYFLFLFLSMLYITIRVCVCVCVINYNLGSLPYIAVFFYVKFYVILGNGIL